MNPVQRLLHYLGYQGWTAGNQEFPVLDRALESSRKKLHATDPETDQQWRLLRAALDGRRETIRSGPAKARSLRPALAFGLAVATILVVVFLSDRGPSLIEHQTGRGQQTTIVLADSSEITLNHTSRLTLGSNSGEASRSMSLEGEAYFRVRRTGSPFVVATDLGTVQVLGTEFNVRRRADRLEVAVVKGSVRVTSESEGAEHVIVLEGGERTMRKRGENLQQPTKLGNPDYPGWVHGKLFFFSSTLAEACREIGDSFDVSVTVEVSQESSTTLTGAIEARTPEAAVATLARLTNTRYRHDQSGYTLY